MASRIFDWPFHITRKKYMQTTEAMLAPTEQNLDAIGDSLKFHAKQAWMTSAFYASDYLNDHATKKEADSKHDIEGARKESFGGPNSNVGALLAAAGRLEWLLREARPSLSGRLSERDVITLLDCYQGHIFSPDNFDYIPSDLCAHLGIELDLYGTSEIAPLVAKLLDLNAIQRLTLADALEQAWHRGMMQEGESPTEFFATLDINLS
jgi:hypothetical protein